MVAMVSRKRQQKKCITRHVIWPQNMSMLLRPGLCSMQSTFRELTALSRPPSWIWEGIGGRSMEGMKGKGKVAGASCSFCHQMSYFKATKHQILLRLGFCPYPIAGAYSLPRLPGWIEGPTSKGRKDKREWQERKSGKGRRGEEDFREYPVPNFPLHHCLFVHMTYEGTPFQGQRLTKGYGLRFEKPC